MERIGTVLRVMNVVLELMEIVMYKCICGIDVARQEADIDGVVKLQTLEYQRLDVI